MNTYSYTCCRKMRNIRDYIHIQYNSSFLSRLWFTLLLKKCSSNISQTRKQSFWHHRTSWQTAEQPVSTAFKSLYHSHVSVFSFKAHVINIGPLSCALFYIWSSELSKQVKKYTVQCLSQKALKRLKLNPLTDIMTVEPSASVGFMNLKLKASLL